MNEEVAKHDADLAKAREEKSKTEAANRQLQEEISKLRLELQAAPGIKSNEGKGSEDLRKSLEAELKNIRERMGNQLEESEKNLKNEKNERNKVAGTIA